MTQMARDAQAITDETRQELENALARGGFARGLDRASTYLVLMITLGMVASGFSLLVVFVFANLLFHINPGL